MKKFNRILAMLLALVITVGILPVAAFADAWLDVNAEKTQTGNVTSTDVTVTVDPATLLSYLKDGDLKGLLKGVSLTGGIGSIMTAEEFFAIVPKSALVDLFKAAVDDIDAKELLSYITFDELLACVDKDGLIDLFTGISNLEDYVKDFDASMKYVDKKDIEGAVGLVKTDLLINDYSDKLMDLALGLDNETLFSIVDIDAAVALNGIDLAAAAVLDYFKNEIGYDTLANSFVNKAALDAFVDGNYDRFSAVIPAYVKTDALAPLLGNVAGDLEDYIVDMDKAETIVRNAYDAGAFDGVDLSAYYDGVTFNVAAMLANNILADLYDDFLNASVFDVKALLFGKGTLVPLFPDLAALITEGVLDVEELLDNNVIEIKELIANDVISVQALRAAGHAYDDMADIAVIKTQIQTAINNKVITSNDIINCLNKVDGKPDYTAAVKAIGVEKAVNATCGYEKLINVYVSDVPALINKFNVDKIANEILDDGKLENIFDVEGLIGAVSPKAIAAQVNVEKAAKVIYKSGVLKALVGMVDFGNYVEPLTNLVAAIEQNVTAIAVDGVVITEKNGEYLSFDAGELLKAVESLIPTLNELQNIGDDGVVFDASFAISYLDGDVEKTKEINLSVVLTGGVEYIRAAAAKLSALIDKIGDFGIVDGKLVVDVTIPSEFATVLRMTLEKMADSSDPEFNALKDKILAAYEATPDDFIAFAEGLTVEEIVAVLEAVDPAIFSKVYNKALASRYAEVLLMYIEKVTGYDLSDNLEVQNIVKALETIPTFEQLVEKLEKATGFEITDRLPAKVNGYLDATVYDVIDKLADRVGADFDMQSFMKQAAASEDPLAFFYTAVVNKFENSGAVYNAVKVRALKVADRLLASRYGQVIADNCLMDFYRGNSRFVFDKDITFNAKAVLDNTLDRVIGAVAARTSLDKETMSAIKDFLMAYISEGGDITTGFDVTVQVNNLYKAQFKNEYGTVILTTLLPAGISIEKMVDYTTVEGFNGWLNEETGEYVTVMPKQDVVLLADVDGVAYHTVTIIPVLNGVELGTSATVAVLDGSLLENYLADLNAAAATLYPALTAEEALLKYTYAHEWDDAIFDATVEEDITIYANISLDKNAKDAALQINGLENGVDFEIVLTDDACTVVLADEWNALLAAKGVDALDFSMNAEFLSQLNRALVFTSVVADAQKVTLNNKMVALLAYEAAALSAINAGLTYAPAVADYAAESGAVAYDFTFSFDTVAVDLGNFQDGAAVEIVLPFAAQNESYVKTFVYVDEDELNVDNGVTATDKTVTFNAPHFSTVTVVNKYSLTIEDAYVVEGFAADELANLPAGPIAIATGIATGWYAQGNVFNATFAANTAVNGVEYAKTLFNGVEYTGSYVMPNAAVTVQHVATIRTYKVYYYVNGALQDALTVSYTAYDKTMPTAQTLTKLPAGYAEADGWSWFGFDSSKIAVADMSLFLISNTQSKFTVEFYLNAADTTATKSYTYTLAEWMNGNFANLEFTVDSDPATAGYIWKDISGKALAEYTLKDLITGTGTVKFYGEKDERDYHVFTDGNATVDKADAKQGETVTVTAINKVGMTVTGIKVVNKTTGLEVDVTNNTFVMPAADVTVSVSYESITITYTDKNGNEKTGAYGTVNTIVVTVPTGAMLNATDITTLEGAPADLVLVKAERGTNGELILTYRYTLTEAVNEQALFTQINALIAAAQGSVIYIVNGTVYNTEAEANAAELPKGAAITGWTDIAPNVKVAIVEYVEKDGVSPWVVVCIILAVLLVLAVIALIYVLYVSGKLGRFWLTIACTAVVTAFFAFCMFIARCALKVLNLLGVKEEDVMEELPEEPVEDIPAVYIDPESLTAEEEAATEEAAAEEAVEATEEAPVEEAAEEATEEVVEEAPAEEVAAEEAAVEETVEATEEAPVEEAAEETTEEVVEEAPAEEVAEEATEEVVEEAPVEEATEEATEEVVEETPAEEAAAEEAAVEETVEEAAEDATEEEVTEKEKKDE